MRTFRPLLSLFLCITLLFGCTRNLQVSRTDNPEFTNFAENLFTTMAASDSLTLNYTIASPRQYGIQTLPDGLPSFIYEEMKADATVYENMLASLESFSISSLSFQQQVLYRCLQETLENDIQGQNYLDFSQSIGPTTGIQAQLPVLLAEFRFDETEDIDQYFSLLRSIPNYFSSLLALEQHKRETKTLPSQGTLERIREQCQEFLDSDGQTMLTNSFEKKLSDLAFLTDTEKESYRQEQSGLVTDYVIPAYETFIEGITSLIPYAGTEGNLCSYPNGGAYYDFLVKEMTGSGRSTSELEQEMTETLNNAHTTLINLAAKNPSLFSTCQSYVTKFHSSEEILDTLKEKITADFPSIGDVSYEVKSVDSSLENFLSPAFYLTPPIDDADDNVIYINNSQQYDSSSLFNTLAHEGYPGHLFQTCYMYRKNLPNLRYLLDYGGYTEGWATYSEIYSYSYTGISDDEAAILQNNMIQSLCLYGLCDIGVHANGWDETDCLKFLRQYGNWSEDTAENVYNAVTDEPASYLKYTVGYMEILRLKEKMKTDLGDSYSEKTFHTFMLDMGPASFPLLEDFMEEWCLQNGCIS